MPHREFGLKLKLSSPLPAPSLPPSLSVSSILFRLTPLLFAHLSGTSRTRFTPQPLPQLRRSIMSDLPMDASPAPAASTSEVTTPSAPDIDMSSKRARSPTPPPTTTTTASTSTTTSESGADSKKAKIDTPPLTEEELALNASSSSEPARLDAGKGKGSSASRGKKPARKWDGKDRLPGTGPGRMSKNARDLEDEAILAAGGTVEKREGGEPRLPKKKTVVMLGFSGTGRKGMQMYVDSEEMKGRGGRGGGQGRAGW